MKLNLILLIQYLEKFKFRLKQSGENIIGLIVLCMLGFTVFENSLGFFIVAKGSHALI